MKRGDFVVLLAAAMTFCTAVRRASPQLSSGQRSFHVSGVVLREGTKVPVPRCHLAIRLEGQRSDRTRGAQNRLRTARRTTEETGEQTTETDTQGRFSFDLPAEGRWQLRASAVGFRTQLYNEHEGYSSAVVVRTGLALPNLVFLLEPDSTISGFVLDEAGEAVRNAVLTLQPVDAERTSGVQRQRAATDDRGHYEIDEVPPGSYKVAAQATPWYAAGAGRTEHDGRPSSSTDAAFDVVYPITWYPGVFDSTTAGEIKVHTGEAAQVNFNLLPVAAAHLRLAGPTDSSSSPLSVPIIERVEADTPTGVTSPISLAGPQLEFGGLAPGMYRVSTSQADGRSTTAFLHVAAGSTIALNRMDTAGTADVTCRFAGDEKAGRMQVLLTDISSGARFSSSSRDRFGFHRRIPPVATSPAGVENERHIAAPAGQYLVTLTGDPDLYLKSLSLNERPVNERLITVSGGSTILTLHVARGHALLTGRARVDGRPEAGAMILLVPASFGQPAAVDLLRRDQSNTDGSFELENITPGDYILLAITQGWTVNWHDPTLLARYLLHGIPLSLKPHDETEQDVSAQLR